MFCSVDGVCVVLVLVGDCVFGVCVLVLVCVCSGISLCRSL